MCTLIRYLGFMVGVIYAYVDIVFGFHCLVGCFSMIAWTSAVLSVLYTSVLYFLHLRLFSAIEHVSHGKAF